MSPKKMTQLSLLTAAALILYLVELQFPAPIPVPGIKLGLANIITVVAVERFRVRETALLVAVRVILGAFFAGSVSTFLFSAGGAVCCLCGMSALKRFLSAGRTSGSRSGYKNLVLYSMTGAVFHNIGQISAAVLVMRNPGVLAYLPVLMVTGCVAGLFTGVCAGEVEKRLPYV